MDILMPQLGETVSEGTLISWHKKVGERVAHNETLFDVATDKVDTEVPAPVAGVVAEILVEEGATVAVGTRLAVIAEEGGAKAAAPVAAAAPAAPAPSAPSVPARAAAAPAGTRNRDARGRVLSPVVRRLVAEHRFDPAAIDGTGAGGRVTRRDVTAYLAKGPAARTTALPERTVIPFSRIRRLTAGHMVRSKATSPHVLQAVEAEFHRVDAVRRARGAGWRAREGFSLTYLPFIARAVCLAIPDFPHVNASVEDDSLVVHGRIHLGIAVDLDLDGLTVPVIRDAGARSLADLARAIHTLAARARAGSLGPDDFAGGTYTLSNSGSFGTLITAPIINQPQVAILSTDGVRKRPVVVEGPDGDSIAIRPVGILAQSFDHRVVDGAYSAAFLGRLRTLVETHDWESELG
jgi:2-oxoglutarate dehydrogenase E2 component (dihydrolipoamide succinyltransferase)